MWKYKCPICGEIITEDYTIDIVKDYIGATHDCPKCDGLLMIEKDLSVSEFGNELVHRYNELGVDVSKEDATGTFIEFEQEINEVIIKLWGAVDQAQIMDLVEYAFKCCPYIIKKDILRHLYQYAKQDGCKSGVLSQDEIEEWLKKAEQII